MATKQKILIAPSPRKVNDIFDENDLSRFAALGELVIHDEDTPLSDAQFNDIAADLIIVIGQIDLPQTRLEKAPQLRAIINVEGNFLPNIDYAYALTKGIRVLNVSPVFAEPVAEAALGMAIDLARHISKSDRAFRSHEETYGLEANEGAFSLFNQTVGFIGFGDLGKATLPLLKPFNPKVKIYDPWLPNDYIASFGVTPASLEDVLSTCQVVFVVAGVTSQNQGFLGKESFESMLPGAALILVSRAGVVDFDAMLDAADSGKIRVATDVFPEEPLPANHRARSVKNVLLSPHQAGALHTVLQRIGKLAIADAEMIAKGLPPILCKVAQPETVALFRSKPVSKS